LVAVLCLALVGWSLPVSCGVLAAKDPAQHGSANKVTPAQALAWLQEGNARFTSGQVQRPNATLDRVRETASGQQPFAVVLTCSDSRVPAELLFDRGVGDIFVVRVAGNVCAVDELASLEYAVRHLGTPLVVVMGHSQCGAVSDAASAEQFEGPMAELIVRIRPAVSLARAANPGAGERDLIAAAVAQNVRRGLSVVAHGSPAIRDAAASGKVQLVGAVYDLQSGRVQWLTEDAANSPVGTQAPGDQR
jgi:carbonic anhydrase